MSRYVVVRLTVRQAEAVENALIATLAGEVMDGWEGLPEREIRAEEQARQRALEKIQAKLPGR